MINKVAILIDGAFFFRRYETLLCKKPSKKDVSDFCEELITKMQTKTGGCSQDVIFRILYYDCLPYGGVVKTYDGKDTIDYSQTKGFFAQTKFLNELKRSEKFALRLGLISFDGWKLDQYKPGNYKPSFRQKGVDMKIGLDMAWMASRKSIDKLVLVAGDSDFISPMKLVRREGILIYLAPMKHKVKGELIEHSDYLLQ